MFSTSTLPGGTTRSRTGAGGVGAVAELEAASQRSGAAVLAVCCGQGHSGLVQVAEFGWEVAAAAQGASLESRPRVHCIPGNGNTARLVVSDAVAGASQVSWCNATMPTCCC